MTDVSARMKARYPDGWFDSPPERNCVDCMHHRTTRFGGHRCFRPIENLVTGVATPLDADCASERAYAYTLAAMNSRCCPVGWYHNKPEPGKAPA